MLHIGPWKEQFDHILLLVTANKSNGGWGVGGGALLINHSEITVHILILQRLEWI